MRSGWFAESKSRDRSPKKMLQPLHKHGRPADLCLVDVTNLSGDWARSGPPSSEFRMELKY